MKPTIPILTRSEEWVVAAKPAHLVVHRNANEPEGLAALQLVRDAVGERVNAVHRLDRPASGCLLFGIGRRPTGRLHTALRAPDAQKTYLAFVRGYFPHEEPVVVTNPMRDDNGVLREAESVVELLGRSQEPRCSLLRVRPKTGRFHQVRRHVRDLHHPILGDSAHGDTRVNREWREQHGFRRLGLHCLSLDLPLEDGSRLQATCPLYADLADLFRQMPWWEEAVRREPALALDPLPVPDYVYRDHDAASPTEELA